MTTILPSSLPGSKTGITQPVVPPPPVKHYLVYIPDLDKYAGDGQVSNTGDSSTWLDKETADALATLCPPGSVVRDMLPAPVAPSVPPLSAALDHLRQFRQFIVWKAVPDGDSKPRKVPCDYRNGRVGVDPHDSQHWADYESAAAAAASLGADYGVGFVLTREARVAVIDYDNALLPDGTWHPTVLKIHGRIPNAAIEVSHSRNGAHDWFMYQGEMPAKDINTVSIDGLKVELFVARKFIALGYQLTATGNAGTDYTAELKQIIADHFPQNDSGRKREDWSDTPEEGWKGFDNNDELIRRFVAAGKNDGNVVFGEKLSNAQLWNCDEQALANWKEELGRKDGLPFDATKADFSLAGRLNGWTGNNFERTHELMQMSPYAEVRKTKWADGVLRRETIAKAYSEWVYGRKDEANKPKVTVQAQAPITVIGLDGLPIGADGIVLDSQFPEFFKGCTYVKNEHGVLTPEGFVLKPEVFNVQYAGYEFPVRRGKSSTDEAFKAFTKSSSWRCPTVRGTCFKPALPFGEIVEREGVRLVNNHVKLDIRRMRGDASPMLDLAAKQFPVERDRTILSSYIASMIRNQGTKFRWAPLLQGLEGNGKTMWSRIVEYCVGQRYTHHVKAKELGDLKFNKWMEGNIFYAVEDLFPGGREDVMENLKPLIDGRRQEIEAKNVDQVTSDICGNWIFNTNHKNALRVTDLSRRYAMLFTAQQNAGDLERDGMGMDYFVKLNKWLEADGYAIMYDYFMNYAIPAEFDPAGDCQRAPETSSSREAISTSRGPVEQDIQESIDQEEQGFRGGWISLTFVKQLPRVQKLNLTPAKLHEILEGMGYVIHPRLKDGRTDNKVVPDNVKAKLYIHRTSMFGQFSASEAARSYQKLNSASYVASQAFSQEATQ